SLNRTQSCATCHQPERAFIDPRDNGIGAVASRGDDGVSLGQRNAPTLLYALFSPVFQQTASGQFVGGQFLDGRQADLAGQAGEPPIGPAEMGLPDKAAVVARIMENPEYVSIFKSFYGDLIFDDVNATYSAMQQAIAEFEMSDEFAAFDSKYDRFLAGEYQMTPQESLGRALFFSAQFTNCSSCHQLQGFGGAASETFSNYEYHNIGTPRNDALLAANGGRIDNGLQQNTAAASNANLGKIKVPTLRNVAVTGPYMHNGVFADLRTVVLFYDKFNNAARTVNPETGQPWRGAEFPSTVNFEELEAAPALSDEDVDALVAFLRTLTDRRFEQLDPPNQ
ncbi:MAG: c-type cytochrome, partial [Bdellovibrionales bacterium]|nr:c-type cytochrome [Bdellovibrionales bacterium]